jgi:1-acyl-sn-glycerol-3-phosphate acyltransferase
MLDLAQLDRIRLHPRPWAQRALAYYFLAPQYRGRPGVTIEFEGYEKVPDEPVVFAMNHTDYYTFFPFMYELIVRSDRYTSAWVKGKNYDSPFMAKFMEVTNQIPVPSRGYLIARDFVSTVGRRPTEDEYTALRRFVDRDAKPENVPEALLTRPRDVLGRPFDPARETYAEAMRVLLDDMMGRFLELNRRAFDVGLDLLVFPQGGRSVRLSRGRIGLAQVALHFQKAIVPVSANYVDLVYPGGSIMAKRGHVIYRFGDPIPYETLAKSGPGVPFEPFTRAAEDTHRAVFQALVDGVMDRIDEGLDERHRYTADRSSDGLSDTSRFV